jgi:hypothetical protein
MTPDVGRLIRLRSTIRATVEAAERHTGKSGALLVGAYQAARAELKDVAGEDLAGELDRVIPDHEFGGKEAFQDRFDFGIAKVMLSRLAGWIDGLIEEAQYAQRLAAEAEAYAEARVKGARHRVQAVVRGELRLSAAGGP